MHIKESPQVVTIGECLRQIRFPLPLLLDKINDFMGVRGSDVSQIAVELTEILGEFQREPLEMVHPFESAELRDVSGVRCPSGVVGIHESIVLL